MVVTLASPRPRHAVTIRRSRLPIVPVVMGLLSVCAGTTLAQSPRLPGTQSIVQPSGSNFVPPPGSPDPNMALTTGSLSPIMTFVFTGLGKGGLGLDPLALPDDNPGFGPFATSDPDMAPPVTAAGARAAPLYVNGGWAQAIVTARNAPGRNAPTCYDDRAAGQLQDGGEFWTPQARSATPVQFPAAVFTSSSFGGRDPVALGPAGHPVNLPAEGPAGSWCRPPPVPMSQSSPLVTRAFWIVMLFPAGVFIVFSLSRGLRLKAMHAR